MRLLNIWQKVGPPTKKRSGTLAFVAVISAVLLGGTAMAANLGLLTRHAPSEAGYHFNDLRPPLVVSLPTTEYSPTIPTPSSTASTTKSTSSSEPVDADRAARAKKYNGDGSYDDD